MAEDQITAVSSAEGGVEVSPGAAPAPPAAQPPLPLALDVVASDGEEQVSPLQAELEMVSMERDDYRQKLEAVEAELASLTAASPDADTINKLQQDNDHLRKTLKKATDMLREKITLCNVHEKKNLAFTQQVKTLKDVLQVTRDLLNIRNLEVEQLQKNVDSMEARIDDNRRRQTAMIKQMEQATKVNGELRNEYETQLKIFQSLKERYEEKVAALTNLAKQRQRSNSESSEKFEDAPETANAVQSTNDSNLISIQQTESAPFTSNAPEATIPEAEATTTKTDATTPPSEATAPETEAITPSEATTTKTDATTAPSEVTTPETETTTPPSEATTTETQVSNVPETTNVS